VESSSHSWTAFVRPCAGRGVATGVALGLSLVPIWVTVSAVTGALGWTSLTVVVVVQGVYLSGVLRTGIEGGLVELGRAADAMKRRDGWIPVSLAAGLAFALGAPVGHVVYMRLGGWIAELQFFVLLAVLASEGGAILLLAAFAHDRWREAALVLGCAGAGLIAIGLPAGAILPFALSLADRLVSPPPRQEP
jgi:hypothetical protein